MKNNLSRFISTIAGLAIFLAAFLILRQLFDFAQTRDSLLLKDYAIYFLTVSYLIAALLVPVDCAGRDASYRKILYRTSIQAMLAMGIFAFSFFVIFDLFAGRFYLLEGCVSLVAALLFFFVQRAVTVSLKRNRITVAIVGTGPNALRLYRTLISDRQYSAYSIMGFFTEDETQVPEGQKYLGSCEAIEKAIPEYGIKDIYCCLNPSDTPELVNDIIRSCENLFINFFYVPNLEGYLNRSMSVSEIGHVIVMNLRDEPLAKPLNILVKRVCDVVFSFVFLCTLFPFFYIFAAIGIKLSSPGPVFFKQKRTGYKGEPFMLLKFRSMRVNSDADTLMATKDDPRKTKFGDFLRRTSIDELPQFINVLNGDMSIIGPRPHMEVDTRKYAELVDEFMVRHAVKPGLTGWAQVNGCRGEHKELRDMEERVRRDIWYIEHWSMGLDVKIFLMTIWQILKGDEQAY
ncbi:MAG: exopolysaccharide biosynthesis polyprenyl glycosylphosphotransferase [Bacteroidales bacterium]|nr:exopolysaccharide biosynthesis polyprenyl glycosylphosphotransferase [Bacteroidales bacterium]